MNEEIHLGKKKKKERLKSKDILHFQTSLCIYVKKFESQFFQTVYSLQENQTHLALYLT